MSTAPTSYKSHGRWQQAPNPLVVREARSPHEGERRLMAAVLEDAVTLYREGPRSRTRTTYAELDRWLASDDRSTLFTFLNLCDVLGLDAERVRRYFEDLRTARMLRQRVAALTDVRERAA